MIHDLIVSLYGETTYQALALVVRLYPIWLPIVSGIVFWELWVRYVRYVWFITSQMVLLEIKVPRDVYKSPMAMEIAVLGMHQTGRETTSVDRYWKGQVRAYSSLEIVSVGGAISFYIWVRKDIRDIVESQLYSQYPNIEITEASDYVKTFNFNPDVNDLWGCHYEYTRPEAFPIKTYIDYGLDKDPKEEFKHDPLTSILEFFSAIKEDEQLWLQFVIRAHKKEKRQGFLSERTDWEAAARGEIKKILEKVTEEGRQRPTRGESEMIESIERSLGKFPFDCGIRAIYMVQDKKKLNKTIITGLRGLFRPFNSHNLNNFKNKKGTDFDYPWQDYMNVRVNRMKRRMLDSYKRRMFFYYPYKGKTQVMTNEELATVYHFPGQVAPAPGLTRIPSKRAQAPSNLPT